MIRQLCLLTFALALTRVSQAQTFTQRVAANLAQPTFATAPAGDNERLFVTEKATGRITILNLSSGEILPDPFLTVPGLATQSEAGLLGLAFHPEYITNGKFYVYASQQGGSQDHQSQIFEYTVDGDPATSNVAALDSQRSVMRFDQPFGNHNGGWIGFGPTATGDAINHLYIASGDGGSGGDPRNNSQDITDNFLGKVLRIDIAGDDFAEDEIRNYSIPPSNPFFGDVGDDEIFAYGLRNPWRNSFDRATGDLWIGDVGQGDREEIDLIPAGSVGGQNFGWRVMEGNRCFNAGDARDGNLPCDDVSFSEPFYEYDHGFSDFQGNSVTGGYVYRGPLKEFQGHYLFADFQSGNIWSMNRHTRQVTRQNDVLEPDEGTLRDVASFAEDNAGNLYMIAFGGRGSIYRVDSTSRDARWVGDDENSGNAGDGATWSDANNWVRDGVADTVFVNGDHLVLGGPAVTSAEERSVSALTFESDAELTLAANLEIISGNIFVEAAALGRITASDGRLTAGGNSNGFQKLGSGRLETDEVGRFYLLDGTTTFLQGGALIAQVKRGATMEQFGTPQQFLMPRLVVDADATLELTAATPIGNAPPINQAVISISRELELDGRLIAHLPENYALPEQGKFEKIPLLDFAGPNPRIGDFEELLVGDAQAGHQGDGEFLTFRWETQESGEVLYLLAYQALPGDADGNGEVNFRDFLDLAVGFGGEGDWPAGDFTGDGRLEFDDFLSLANNYGDSATEFIAPSIQAVPEPSGLLLAIGMLVVVLLPRRR